VIHSEALRQDVKEPALRKQIVSGQQPAPADDIIITAVRNMALHDATTVQLEVAQKQIRQLETQLEDLRKYIQEGGYQQEELPL
jgi:hypothetical protein